MDNIESLLALLAEEEAEMASIRDRRDRTIRQIRKAKLDATVPSEEARKFARNEGPMNDEFFNKIGEDPEAIGEIISTILGVRVKVLRTTPQYTITNIGSRGVRLDNCSEVNVEAELLDDSEWGKKGATVDIEVQMEDNDDHEFRVYYNGASMVINRTPPGTKKFGDIARAIVIYISSFDIFRQGKVFYETRKYDVETLEPRRSPVSEFYVNTENIEEGEKDEEARVRNVADLMKVFKDPDWYDDRRFPAFSKRKKTLHETEEGVEEVAKEIQLLIDEKVKSLVDEKVKSLVDEKVKSLVDEETNRIRNEADMTQVNSIRSLKETLGWSTQQVMDAMRLEPAMQARYAAMV